ncbi:permease [Gemmatirosa kalamazoonensis]|uniref:Permease n=1 Tax=Gemmatirosa kalamazoonensis TaxID=861299 RepID=W0RAK7_9BACT|nr:ABC transporter permease [Gemmatirosa kalamazoonensis]AHG87816.1 permease [Gemmatirosa kalamazoonensis]
MPSDLTLALRSLRRAPGFLTAVVLTLALGIGATTAIFTVVDAMLLRPLPYRDAARLVAVWANPANDATIPTPASYPDFADWRAALGGRRFDDVAFARSEGLLLRGTESAVSLNVAYVSDGFFRVLGGRPLLGRTFRPDEERAGAPHVIVLGHRLWRTRFGADPSVIGRTLDFAEGSYTVVGVMPPGYEYPGRWTEAWAPLAPLAAERPAVAQRLERRDLRVDSRVIARLAPGVSAASVGADLAAVARRLAVEHPDANRDIGAHVVPLREELVGSVRTQLLVLLGAVGLLLLVACADVANLSLVRATARARELAVRAALGAERARLLRRLLAESVVVALAGGAFGVLLAIGGVAALRRAAPEPPLSSAVPRLDAVAVDGRVLAFALVVSLATVLLFGLGPALNALRAGSARTLREGTRSLGGGAGARRFRDAVTVAQVALTLVLLVGGGLLGRSFLALRAQDAGFPVERLVVLRVAPLAERYETPERLVALYDRLRAAAAAIPGVRAAGIVNHLALTGAGIPTRVRIAGGPDTLGALFRVADGGYFAASGIPVRRGRALDDADQARAATPDAADVPAVVDAELARTTWPGQDPLGRRFTVFKQASGRADFGRPVQAVVVGVAGDVKFQSLADATPIPTVYLPMTVNPWRWGYLVVRAAGDPAALVASVRRAVRGVDPDIPVTDVRTGATLVGDTMSQRRFDLALVLAFALSALALAAVGVYGVVAQGTVLRAGELAVRSAIGAGPTRLVRLVLRGAATLAGVGIVLGAALSVVATRVLGSLLFGVGRFDVVTYVGVAVVLGGVALLASAIPARRAARTDPAAVLRGD